jgi:hypothetical protein
MLADSTLTAHWHRDFGKAHLTGSFEQLTRFNLKREDAPQLHFYHRSIPFSSFV